MTRKICYECGIPCERAGRKLTANSRECTGWKDPNFVGCCALEDPTEALNRIRSERSKSIHSCHGGYNTIQLALKKAGIQ